MKIVDVNGTLLSIHNRNNTLKDYWEYLLCSPLNGWSTADKTKPHSIAI